MSVERSRPLGGAASFDSLPDDAVLLILEGCKLSCEQRFTSAALVCKCWRRLVSSPDLIRQGIEVRIQSAHIERLQSLRRWLLVHAGSLRCLDISLSAAADGKALSIELGRCLAVACAAGALAELRLAWLSRTQLRLGPELAGCGSCASVRRLALSGGGGTISLACPLARLAALEHAELQAVSRWDRLASLPPSLTSLELAKVSDASRTHLPTQLAALSNLRRLTLDMRSADLPDNGYSVLTALSALRHLSMKGTGGWPAVLRQLSWLQRLDLQNMGWWGSSFMGPLVGQAFQQTLQALTALTGLCLLHGLPRLHNPSAALAPRLQWLYDASSWHPILLPGHWPEGLRAACVSWQHVLGGSWQDGLFGDAPQLSFLVIMRSPADEWGKMPRQAAWAAFWRWAERAPALRVLEFPGYSTDQLPMALATALAALKRRRPGLRLSIRGDCWGDSRPNFFQALQAHCGPPTG